MSRAGRVSVALTEDTSRELTRHLLRADGQEDLCLAAYRPSTGTGRWTAVVTDVLLPRPGEREVHGNATVTGDYVLRAAMTAAPAGKGIILLHSHPRGTGWQGMSHQDADAERSYAVLAAQVTGLPLVGMTLAGDGTWSARQWLGDDRPHTDAESVRVLGPILKVSWNDRLRAVPQAQAAQERTVSAWGPGAQADIARLRILIVGGGSVGLDVAVRLAAAGVQHVAVMDFDRVERVNLDRLIGAGRRDAWLRRPKTAVALREMRRAGTAAAREFVRFAWSVCEAKGLSAALDYDVVFSCVDRPWPRAVLNQMAYADLIPVLDGGIAIDAFDDGGIRNATWRSHVLRPGRPCMDCTGQIRGAEVARDRAGLYEDESYIRAAGLAMPGKQNVALLSTSVSAALLAQFVSLAAGVGGRGEPGPLQYSLSTHSLEHRADTSRQHCPVEASTGAGDSRSSLTSRHPAAERARASRIPSWLDGPRKRVMGMGRRVWRHARSNLDPQALQSSRRGPQSVRTGSAEDGRPLPAKGVHSTRDSRSRPAEVLARQGVARRRHDVDHG